jgi:hypothetical protein
VYTATADTLKLRMNISASDCGSYRIRYLGTAVGIEEAIGDDARLTVYPNPSTDGLFYIGLSGSNIAWLQVLDAQGRVTTAATTSASGSILDLSGVLPGVYTLSLLNDEGELIHTRLVRSH